MKKITYSILSGLIFSLALLPTCSKENEAANQEHQISFAISMPDTKNGSGIKGATVYSLGDARKIELTIQNADGTPTKYSSSEVTIYEMNGVYFSQKLMLKTGTTV